MGMEFLTCCYYGSGNQACGMELLAYSHYSEEKLARSMELQEQLVDWLASDYWFRTNGTWFAEWPCWSVL
jgi:hypothetical protein